MDNALTDTTLAQPRSCSNYYESQSCASTSIPGVHALKKYLARAPFCFYDWSL